MNRFTSKKSLLILVIITLLGLFFYSFRLKETQIFTDDTARDTLKALQIWQNKELTLIGPPASFSLNTIREVYFGSFYLYIGILGLMAANWDPVGAVLPNTLLFTLSIPLFYYFLSLHNKDKFFIFFATFLYTLSPVTVIHSRFFWNPNLIIPLSVLFFILATKKYENKKKIIFYSFISGIVAGIMFNLHYLIILPVFLFILIIFLKQKLKSLVALLGFLIASIPIMIFELRHNFYLSQSFWFNLFGGSSMQTGQASLIKYWDRLLNIFETILGLRPAEIEYPTLINYSPVLFTVITLIFLAIIILRFKEIKKYPLQYLLPVALSLGLTVYFSFSRDLLVRYMFAVYPLLILLIAKLIYLPRYKYLSLIIFIPILYASLNVILDEPMIGKSYLPLKEIERACDNIVRDFPSGRYNVTENIRGDARAMAFRYCLQKDAGVKPQNELTYESLSALYVISPSLGKIYQEKRWEFTASAPWKLVSTDDIGSVYLYKFVK
jgi:hypothetical protein